MPILVAKLRNRETSMECLTEEFSGEQDQVAFRFHGEKLEEGDVVKGTFDIISDRGEYYLPFVASVEHVMPESSVGTVKNLFHFANLAKSDWKEAVKLFYSPDDYLLHLHFVLTRFCLSLQLSRT